MNGIEDPCPRRRSVAGCPRSAGRSDCPTGASQPADPSAGVAAVAQQVLEEQQPPVAVDGVENAVPTVDELPDALEVLADLTARPGVPARGPVRGVPAVAQQILEEQQPAVAVDGIENAVPTADELPDALEVLADLTALLGVPARRSVRGVGAVPQQILEEQQPPVLVNGVEDPTGIGGSHHQLLGVVRQVPRARLPTCEGAIPQCSGSFSRSESRKSLDGRRAATTAAWARPRPCSGSDRTGRGHAARVSRSGRRSWPASGPAR